MIQIKFIEHHFHIMIYKSSKNTSKKENSTQVKETHYINWKLNTQNCDVLQNVVSKFGVCITEVF
jgi:hypothetical protein